VIKGEILGGPQTAKGLRDRAPRIMTGLERAIATLAIKLQRNIVTDKLQGQVLHVRSGRLQRSITQRPVDFGTAKPSAVVGTNVSYAKPHEFGFQGTVNVPEHLRMQKLAWGREMKDLRQVVVRAHPMRLNFPERSFMRSALAEMRPEILGQIARAVSDGAKR
jgi:phage gpG-like protein